MRIEVKTSLAMSRELNNLGDAVWAAQKDNADLTPEVRDHMKQLSTAIHTEAARIRRMERP